MASKRILLWDIESPVLIVEHASGVHYQNQVNGVVCWQAEIEGVMAPLHFPPEIAAPLAALDYPQGIGGISSQIADSIDALLASTPSTSFLKVDRDRLDDSCEAWIYVSIETPLERIQGEDHGSVYGFGTARGVLTWEN